MQVVFVGAVVQPSDDAVGLALAQPCQQEGPRPFIDTDSQARCALAQRQKRRRQNPRLGDRQDTDPDVADETARNILDLKGGAIQIVEEGFGALDQNLAAFGHVTPRLLRSNIGRPKIASSSPINLLIAGWVRCASRRQRAACCRPARRQGIRSNGARGAMKRA